MRGSYLITSNLIDWTDSGPPTPEQFFLYGWGRLKPEQK